MLYSKEEYALDIVVGDAASAMVCLRAPNLPGAGSINPATVVTLEATDRRPAD
jgi:hypothetical protein